MNWNAGAHRKYGVKAVVGLLAVAVAFPLGGLGRAGALAREEVIKGRDGASVRVSTGNGCAGKTMDIDSGEIADPTPGRASTLVVDVDANCNVRIAAQGTNVPVTPDEPGTPPGAVEVKPGRTAQSGSTGFEPATLYGNYIRSSQTLQDVVNIDIAKWKWTHDRLWDDYYAATRFKAAGEDGSNYVYWGRASTSVSWNHAVGAYYDGANTSWCSLCTAHSYSHGTFHSDFLWCNFQPGQDFNLRTTLDSKSGGGYDAHFSQSNVCSGTHMATSKSTSTAPPPF